MRATLDVLKSVRARIGDPRRWCQRMNAVDADGFEAAPDASNACRWCVMGALFAETTGLGFCAGTYRAALATLNEAVGDSTLGSVAVFNDGHSHGEVIAMLDRAIESARGGAA